MDKSILRKFSYGVYIITTSDHTFLAGCVANSIMQINSDTIAISLNKENTTTNTILKSKIFGINVLYEDTEPTLIGTFGFQKSDETNKFTNVDYEIIENVPILKKTCGYVTCEVLESVETTTHIVILGKITNMNNFNDLTPMTYKYYQEKLKGKTNPKAPTYQEEKKEEEKSSKHVFVCKICGYQHIIDAEELPDDFKCPICGVGKENFEKLS